MPSHFLILKMKGFRPDLRVLTVGLLYISIGWGLRDAIGIDDLRKGNEPKSKIVRPPILFGSSVRSVQTCLKLSIFNIMAQVSFRSLLGPS